MPKYFILKLCLWLDIYIVLVLMVIVVIVINGKIEISENFLIAFENEK